MTQALELLIEEPSAGQFLWKLVNQNGPGLKPQLVDFAIGPLPTRRAALEAGNASMARNQAGIGTSWNGGFAETLPMEL